MASKRLDRFQDGLYAHWLDGEWLKIAYPIAVEGAHSTLADIAEGGLKLHALFGTRIAISDAQLTDSEVTVNLFADPEFRKFLKTDPYFLTLVAAPPKGVADSDFACATRGLYRALEQPGWRTSLPRISVDVVRRFANSILETQNLSAANALKRSVRGPGAVVARFPEHRVLLEGILHGVSFFSKKTGGRIATQQQTSRSYITWLEGVLNSQGLRSHDCAALERVWRSIADLVPDESLRYARSSVNNALEARQPDRSKWSTESHTLWNTVVHAWNNNVCENLGVGKSSIVPLPDACVPLRGIVTDVGGPFRSDGALIRKRFERGVLTFDPTRLSWRTINDVVKTTSHLRHDFQAALSVGTTAEICDKGALLIEATTNRIVRNARHMLPHWAWVAADITASRVSHETACGVAVLAGLDLTQQWLRTTRVKAAVFNTLNQFKKELTGQSSAAQ